MRNLTTLVSLNLGMTKVTDNGLARIMAQKTLKSLWLYFATGITDSGLVNLKDMQDLRRLSLSGTSITDAGLRWLESLTQIETL